ncbi:MAG: hypothetical protein JW874_08375 [Spirochaetales bacterium]|nr:hypothetical protein [Spirochaetales bacterium]
MTAKELFHHAYPLSPAEALYTICITRQGWVSAGIDLPDPTVKGSKNFVLFSGASDSAFRTTISREKTNDNFDFYTDEQHIRRFRMTEFGQGVTRFFSTENPEPAGLTMAVFRFETGETRERYILKEALKSFGFRMFAQNTYINRRVRHEEIQKAADARGVGGNLFLFDTNFPSGPAMQKLQSMYEPEKWEKKLAEFKSRLIAYFKEGNSDEDIYNRALYAGAAHHQYIRTNLPPLPEKYFPGLRIFGEICEIIADLFQELYRNHIEVYLRHHGGKM